MTGPAISEGPYARDTHVAGDFLCDDAAVEVVCREGREAVDKLIQFGVDFTKDESGNLHLGRGLHSFTSQLILSRFGHTSTCPPL
jgi:aspartate oxidase